MEPPSSRRGETLRAVIHRQAHERADAPYLFDARSARALTFNELASEVEQRAHQLREWGLVPGERFGLVVADPLSFASWFLAGIASGAWVAPLDPTSSSVEASSARAANLGVAFVVSDQSEPAISSAKWMSATTVSLDAAPALDESENSVSGGIILSSSGTTGTPKVMALGVEQLLATASLIVRHHRFEANDRGFNPLPLWHVNAEVVGLLSTLVAGSSLVLDERFHRTGFWVLVNDFKVTWINAVPAIISRLATLHDGEVPSRAIRFVRSASAPLAPALFERFEADVGVPIIQSYGMTEAASQICVSPIDGRRKAGSVGMAAGVDVRVRADASEIGPIEIKGPTVITHYESPGYDARFDAEGWLRTGDLGYFDEDNYLFIVGRDDDVINRGGEKIYPLEIEQVLASVEGVASVAVIARDDDVFGQVPVAFVKAAENVDLCSLDELAALVSRVRQQAGERLPSTHRPTLVEVVREFPQHATGKIQKSILRQDVVVVVYEERL
jgi:oxalate---CoA ligase